MGKQFGTVTYHFLMLKRIQYGLAGLGKICVTGFKSQMSHRIVYMQYADAILLQFMSELHILITIPYI